MTIIRLKKRDLSGALMALKFIAVGTGRDGTVSLTHIMNDLFKRNGITAVAAHEYLSPDCYNAYALFKETGQVSHLDHLRVLIAECPYDAIVGNGYAPVLPLFREAFPDISLIHLKRTDRDALIASHMQTSSMFPTAYRYYVSDEGSVRRTAAFHEGELLRETWDSLPIKEKFGWYYDYTHRTVSAHASSFTKTMEIATESLSDPLVLAALARFVLGQDGEAPGTVHLNRLSYLAVTDFSEDARDYGHWLFSRLSVGDIETNPVYFSEYVTNKYITLIGYQITGFINQMAPAYAASPAEIGASLDQFEALLSIRLNEVKQLKAELHRKRA
jgi:hypothetical protein